MSHSDLSCYFSDCTVLVSLRRVICLSQWFIMLCLWLYCISITKKSDMSITVIYHAMSLTVLYQYHYEEWYVYHSDLSCYVSDYYISFTKKSDMSITVIYHAMFLTTVNITKKSDMSDCTVSVLLRRVIRISLWFIMLCLTTVSISLRRGIRISQWFIMLCLTTVSISLRRGIHISQWFIMVCLTNVSVLLRRVIGLSQWFITLYPWLNCISIT